MSDYVCRICKCRAASCSALLESSLPLAADVRTLPQKSFPGIRFALCAAAPADIFSWRGLSQKIYMKITCSHPHIQLTFPPIWTLFAID